MLRRTDGALRVVVGALALAGLGFWAPNHIKLNGQVWRDGRPWGMDGFKRRDHAITTATDYLTSYWYLTDPDTLRVAGVPYKTATAVLPGTEKPTDAPSAKYTIADWNAQGGLWEDGFIDPSGAKEWGGRRAVNHFHTPFGEEGGYGGLVDDPFNPLNTTATGLPFIDLARRGISASTWALNATSGGAFGANEWGYLSVGTSFQRVFTEATPEMRESALAAGYRALGQVEHLIEDNAVPDHARNLPHPGDGFEEYMQGVGDKKKTSHPVDWFGAYGGPWITFPLKNVEQGGLRAIWDRDVYDGTNPEATRATGTPLGISEYTNANFFAWNRWSWGPVVIDFSSLPDAAGQPGQQGSFVSIGYLFPWPQLGPLDGQSYGFGGRTMPFSPSAVVGDSGKPVLDASVWSQYAQPAMAAAHGYAQTALALALPPARAEIVPSRQGTFLEFVVRIWNLWPADSPNAVTWHLDEVSIKGIQPKLATGIVTFATSPHVVPGAGRDVVPGGGPWESAPFTLTTQEQFTLTHSTHVGVLVKAHLGTDKLTPLAFSIPIPNGFAVVAQTSGSESSLSSSYMASGCCTDTDNCNPLCGETGRLDQPWEQEITGSITLYPTEKDILGRPADDATKQAMAADTRIAGVALLGYTRSPQDLTKPVAPKLSTLELSGSTLTAISEGGSNHALWLRTADAADAADPGRVTFYAKIDLHDFYFPDAAVPNVDAPRASSNVFLAVWTTAGGLQITPLELWPVRAATLASGLVAAGTECHEAYSRGFPDSGATNVFLDAQEHDALGCWSYLGKDDTGLCTASSMYGGSRSWSFTSLWASLGLLAPASTASVTDSIYLLTYSFIEPRTIGGLPVPLMSVAGGFSVPTCDPQQLVSVVQDGGSSVCASDMAIVGVKNVVTPVDGACAGFPSGQALPRTATYQRTMVPETPYFQAVIGTSPPPAYQITLD